jgi:hypothetical protein
VARKLKPEQQVFIVQCLARFMSPTEVVLAVKEEFSFEIKRELVRHYNPEQSDDVAEQWKTLFEQERKTFLEKIERIGVSHLVDRLDQIQGVIARARRTRNDDLLLRALRQAAEDEGGAYTNKKEISGPKGGVIPVSITGALDKAYSDGSVDK